MDKPEKKSNTLAIVVVAIVVLAIVVGVILLLTKSSSSNGLSASQQSAAKSQIESNWKTFYAASTPLQKRENLLQNGSKFNSSIKTEFNALGSDASSVSISSINFTSSTQANVVYTVYLNKQAVLKDQKGTAILENGAWKVSDQTLCSLLTLAGSKPSACQGE